MVGGREETDLNMTLNMVQMSIESVELVELYNLCVFSS